MMRKYKQTIIILFTTALIFVGHINVVKAQNSVEGSLTVDGTTTELKNIYFDQYKEEITVIITDNPVEPDMIPYGINNLSEQGKVKALEFTVSMETRELLPRMRKAIYFNPVWTRNIDIGNGELTISKFDEYKLVGKIKTPSENESDGHKFTYDVSFTLSLKKEPPKITVTGSSDAPSKAYAAYANALMQGNIEEFKKYVPRENLKLIPEDENEFVLDLEFLQDTMMTNMEIIKSTISGNNAELKIKGSRGIDKADGTVKMVLENGSWKVSEESWELN